MIAPVENRFIDCPLPAGSLLTPEEFSSPLASVLLRDGAFISNQTSSMGMACQQRRIGQVVQLTVNIAILGWL